MEKIQREFDEWKKRSDTIAVDTDVSNLQLLIAKPASVFDHFAAMGALEDVVVNNNNTYIALIRMRSKRFTSIVLQYDLQI